MVQVNSREARAHRAHLIAEARALAELALDAVKEAEQFDFAADVCEDLERLPTIAHESGQDDA